MQKIKIGVIGLGRFGQFLIESFQDSAHAQIMAISDPVEKVTSEVGERFKISRKYSDYSMILKDPLVELIIIATPPSTHSEIAIKALKAGKHIWLEKPPAIKSSELQKVIKLAARYKKRAFVDFELRYSPIWQSLNEINKKSIFGPAESIVLENFASDSGLPPEHWFWDRSISGGIFVEHNIHFFDILFSIFGKGELLFAKSFQREKHVEDRIFAGLILDKRIWTNVYHSFNKSSRLEKFINRVTFQKGYINVKGWIPEELTGSGLVTKANYEKLQEIFPQSALRADRNLKRTVFSGNWQTFQADMFVEIKWKLPYEKKINYSKLVNSVLNDVVRSINDPKFDCPVDLKVALNPLKLAEKANHYGKKITLERD